jgi:2-iminobutanoate/2-iminopropanoate deaminase
MIETVKAKNSSTLGDDVYSTATKYGDLVFMAGQVAVDPKTNELVEGDIETQMRRACENLKLALEDAGTSIDNILTMRFFLRDFKEYRPFLAKVRNEYFPNKPPSTTVAVSGIGPSLALGKGRIEVDCIAARDK